MTVHTSQLGNLSSELSIGDGPASLVLKGQADLRDSTPLADSLRKVHQELSNARTTAIVVDLTQVEFMNSTALGAFATWAAELVKLPREQRYRVTLKGSLARRWQRGSLHALASLVPDAIEVQFS